MKIYLHSLMLLLLVVISSTSYADDKSFTSVSYVDLTEAINALACENELKGLEIFRLEIKENDLIVYLVSVSHKVGSGGGVEVYMSEKNGKWIINKIKKIVF